MTATAWLTLALVTVVALAAILGRNLVRRVVALGALLLIVAAAYLWFDAPLLAAVQMMLYAGGITVLFGFAIGTTGGQGEGGVTDLPRPLLGVAVGAAVIYSGLQLSPTVGMQPTSVDIDVLRLIGDRPLAFEGVGLILLAATIAALALVRARSEP